MSVVDIDCNKMAENQNCVFFLQGLEHIIIGRTGLDETISQEMTNSNDTTQLTDVQETHRISSHGDVVVT